MQDDKRKTFCRSRNQKTYEYGAHSYGEILKMNHYVHHIPGVLQIKKPELKNNTAGLDNIRNQFDGIDGIDYITTNPLTGSAVIRYYPDIILPDRMVALIEDRIRPDHCHASPENHRLEERMQEFARPEYAGCAGYF
jgi:hypothetical protein